jgi:hypothetical protein
MPVNDGRTSCGVNLHGVSWRGNGEEYARMRRDLQQSRTKPLSYSGIHAALQSSFSPGW